MPLGALGIAGIGSAISGIGSMFGQGAANKGPRAIFPGASSSFASLFGPNSTFGSTATGTLQNMMQTGMPTDVGPAWNALVAANARMTGQGMNNLMTQFAGGGARYSSAAMQAGVDYTSQSNQNFMQILANYTMQAQEAARQRQLAAAQMGFSAFQDLATTFTQPKGSVVGAGLSSAGSSLQLISLLKALQG